MTGLATSRAATAVALAPHALHPHIAAVMRSVIDGDPTRPVPPGDVVRVLRTEDRAAEANAVAVRVAALLEAGTRPGRIAVVHRTLRTCRARAVGRRG